MLRSFTEYFVAHKIDGDPGATATAIARALKLSGAQLDVLLPIIEEQCETLDRRRVRSTEADGPAGRKVADPGGERAAYLAERFAVGDGRMVRWADATIEDHQARIVFLERMRGGISATIGRHRAAVQLIEQHDVACLGEITDELPATLVPTAIELDLVP